MKKLLLYITLILFISCEKKYESPVPVDSWELFNSPDATPLISTAGNAMQGIYNIDDAANIFGSTAVVKWTYTIIDSDTIYNLSMFMENDVTTFICEGKRLDSTILLNGYWRKMLTTETGNLRLSIESPQGAKQLFSPDPQIAKDSIHITGFYGNGDDVPAHAVSMNFDRPLKSDSAFYILAHRGGGRSSDLLPVSENSIEMIRYASRLGATGVEVDVRLTSDGVPVLFHDEDLSGRLIQKNGLVGPIGNYTYAQLNLLVRLLHGEKIPSLAEALNSVLFETQIKFVWLDMKNAASLPFVRVVQEYILQQARAANRNLQVVIGIPDDDIYDAFRLIPVHDTIPSLCELDIDHVHQANSKYWAPRWTEGTQNESVGEIHSEGRNAFVWTLDDPLYVRQFLDLGHFDGILSNYPSSVAYEYYVR